ncbi:MAG: SPFH domain-containing protein [Clostridia bacterium]|nr:SPFH domain-containing protein [Clostridia bacterium]
MPLFDRIKFDGLNSREWLVYRFPAEQIKLGSVLIVGEGQAAVFVSRGSIADVFTAGSHVLSTGNLPILGKLVNLAYGGQTPFPAEVYFVNLTTKLDMHWGTTDPIQLIDPKYFVRLHIRAFGQFGVKIADVSSFLRELIGSLGDSAVKYQAVLEFYKGVLNTKVKTIVSDIIINQKISAFEISPKLEQISAEAFNKLSPDFMRYGLRVVNFFIQSVNFPDEDTAQINKILEDKAAFEIMGDSRYAAKRSFDVYEGAANNQSGVAGAFVAGGMGIGMGSALTRSVAAQDPAQAAGIKCPDCGAENKKEARFCWDCGRSLAPSKKKTCFKCGAQLEERAKFCCECGASQEEKTCPKCGAKTAPGAKFCSECGEKQEE